MAQPPVVLLDRQQTQSIESASDNTASNVQTISDAMDHSRDDEEEEMWIDENKSEVDPWKNVQFESTPQYCNRENEFSFNRSNQ